MSIYVVFLLVSTILDKMTQTFSLFNAIIIVKMYEPRY